MRKIKVIMTFKLYNKGKFVGYEVHALDHLLKAGIGIYHKQPDSNLIAGYPVTAGDKYYIFHDTKVIQ